MTNKSKTSEFPVFYAYTQPNGKGRLAQDAKISMPIDGKAIKYRVNTESGKKIADEESYKLISFFSGMYTPKNKTEYDFLKNYNQRNRGTFLFITEEVLADAVSGSGASTTIQLVDTPFVPLVAAKMFDIKGLKEILKTEFNHETKFNTIQEVLDEGTEKGFFR